MIPDHQLTTTNTREVLIMASSNVSKQKDRLYFDMVEQYRKSHGWSRDEFLTELCGLAEQYQEMMLEDYQTEIRKINGDSDTEMPRMSLKLERDDRVTVT